MKFVILNARIGIKTWADELRIMVEGAVQVLLCRVIVLMHLRIAGHTEKPAFRCRLAIPEMFDAEELMQRFADFFERV